jgi:formate transporter
MFISIAFVFYITATTGSGEMAYGMAKLVGGICFSLGLILVVVCGADLFTSTVLIVVAKASGRITWGQLARNWINVYVGNLVGALFFVALMWFSGEHTVANGAWGLNVLQTADHKMHHTFVEAVSLGILANLMVCLAVWMSYSGRTLMDKSLIMILPVAMFVACGFEHSIANMFLIPFAIVIRDFSGPEFWHAAGSTVSGPFCEKLYFRQSDSSHARQHYRRWSAGRIDLLGNLLTRWTRSALIQPRGFIPTGSTQEQKSP